MRKIIFSTLAICFTLLVLATTSIHAPVLAQTNEPTPIATEEFAEETPTPEDVDEPSPTPESPTPEPIEEDPSPTQTPSPEPTKEDKIDISFRYAFSIALFFGFISLVSVIVYFNMAQAKFFNALKSDSTQNKDVSALIIRSFEFASDIQNTTKALNLLNPDEKLKLTGPTQIEVGVAAKYSIEPVDAKQVIQDTFDWDYTDQKDTSQNIFFKLSADTRAATIIADKEGSFKLAISKAQQPPLISVPISAIPKRTPSNNPLQIPFIGQGYGAVIITILLISAVIALGIVKVLSGEGVATILGAIAGYVFGVGRKDNDPPSGTTPGGENT